ncbi:protein FAM171B-like [Genypterus blacodes]|uniref:protein FAM171B-like n=1 Tax=Genypterus blacodes TaxID=154954 RepID=UPI003F75783F
MLPLALCALVLCGFGGRAGGADSVSGHSVHNNEPNFSQQLQLQLQLQHHKAPLQPLPEGLGARCSNRPIRIQRSKEPQDQICHICIIWSVSVSPGSSSFDLKVQVHDAQTRQSLVGAAVDVYVNHTLSNAGLTGEDGVALLRVPYRTGLPVTVVASKEGYVSTLLPSNPSRMPIFSAVTLSLRGLDQGNIWFYEDSVLITGRTSDASSPPVVQFPKKLLNLTDSADVASVRAFLTLPKLSAEDGGFGNTLGIMSSKSGYVSVELSPVAAVSVKLFSADAELDVSGAVQISLALPDDCGLRDASVVPAWFFNRTTGGWMRKGLGTVAASAEGKLTWAFTAPHLGYWIAAPLSSTRGFLGFPFSLDFLLQHSSLIMVSLGGILIVTCLLVGCLCYRRRSMRTATGKRIRTSNLQTKDQTTSTCDRLLSEVSSGDSSSPQSHTHNAAVLSTQNRDMIANHRAELGTIPCAEAELSCDRSDLNISQQARVPSSPTEDLFFFHQPVAILHAPAFFHMEEQHAQWSKSATLPRAGASNNTPTEPQSTHMLPTAPSASQNQAVESEEGLPVLDGSQAAASISQGRGHHGLPESLSVPGTLSNIGGSSRSGLGGELQGNSEHALAELSKVPSPLPPRAWFVSLEGKPAAEIHHAGPEQQRRRRPTESRDTSLDSGVDLSELSQTAGRRSVTLERNATFVKSAASSRHTTPQ